MYINNYIAMDERTRLNYPVDHIGIAVNSLDQAVKTYTNAFSCKLSEVIELADRGIKLIFLEYPGCKLELLEATSKNSVVKKFIDKKGEGLHHICYQVKNINSEMLRLKDLGYTLIDEVSRKGAHGKIAFLHPKSFNGVLVELLELGK